MVEDVLRYKRLDGVPEALAAFAEEWFPGGRQRAGPAMPSGVKLPVQIDLGARRPHHPGRPRRSSRITAFPFTSSSKPDTCRIWKMPGR